MNSRIVPTAYPEQAGPLDEGQGCHGRASEHQPLGEAGASRGLPQDSGSLTAPDSPADGPTSGGDQGGSAGHDVGGSSQPSAQQAQASGPPQLPPPGEPGPTGAQAPGADPPQPPQPPTRSQWPPQTPQQPHGAQGGGLLNKDLRGRGQTPPFAGGFNGRPLSALPLNFLYWPGREGLSRGGSRRPPRGRPGSGSGSPRSPAEGRRGRGAAAPRSRDERIRQLVLASCTLLQLRGVVERHLPDMSAPTAALALSRFTDLAAATHRLRAVVMQGSGAPAAPAAAAAAAASGPQAPEQQQEQQSGGNEEAGTASAGVGAGSTSPSGSGRSVGAQAVAASPQRLNGSASAGRHGSNSADGRQPAGPSGSATSASGAGSPQDPTAPPAAAAFAPPAGSLRVGLPGAQTEASLRRALAAGSAGLQAAAVGGQGGGAASSERDAGSSDDDDPTADNDDADAAPGTSPAGGRTDGCARVHSSSLRLMRRMLKHIAASLSAPGTPAGAASASGGRRGSGARSGAPGWRLSPPEHRARVAVVALSCLARVELRPSGEDAACLHALLEAARPDLFLASPAQLGRLASSLPPLRLRPGAAWLEHFCCVARSKMYAAGPGQLAAWVWALARLGHHPGELWLHSLALAMQRGSNLASASPPHLCQLLWGLHTLGFAPDPEWRAACAAAVTAIVTGARHDGSGGSGVRSHGAGAGGEVEEEGEEGEAAAAPLSAAARRPAAKRGGPGPGSSASSPSSAASASGDVASLLLWAVRTRTAPGPADFEACLSRLQPSLRSLRRLPLLRLLLALAEAGHSPSREFMARLLACMQPKLPLLGAAHLTQLLLALRRLRYVPHQAWLLAFLQVSRAQLRHYSPHHVTATYQVFASWHLRPHRAYLEALHAYADASMEDFSARGLSMLLSSMSSLGVKPPRRWLARALGKLAEAAEREAAGRPQPGAHVRGSDGARSYEEEVEEAEGLGAGASGPQRRRSGLQSPRARAAAALLGAVSSLRNIAPLQGQGPQEAQAEALGGGAEAAPAARPGPPTADSAASVGGGSGGEAGPAPPLLPYELWGPLKRVTEVAAGVLEELSGPELLRLVTGLARLHFYPGRVFLAAHAAATARAGAQLAPPDKEAAAAAYSRLLGLAPHMAAEARRQAAVRQARVSVLVGGDPWAAE